jgi:NAD(P)-dependent dehydrogenase (short-subunit alcohol dehydrogenase family)
LRDGQARVTSQTSVAARTGSINWDDPSWERAYNTMRAYQQSKIAVALFALELGRLSLLHGWGVTSTLSHPGVAPTSLLAARPEVGRAEDTPQVRVIRWLSRRGILAGTVDSASLPALVAATTASATVGQFYGPQGLGRTSGRPGEEKLWKPLRDADQAQRLWTLSEQMSEAAFVA